MKIAIAGYGVEGKTNYTYWSRDPDNQLTIIDDRESPTFAVPDGVPTILGPGSFEKLDGFDLVIRTAGLAPHKIKTDGKVWSATNEFFAKCPAPIIGVTGTKGKGTTASLAAAILEASGKKVWLVGNIGLPGLDVLDQITADDIVVYELSSFQLWDAEKSPHVAIILYMEPDHLEVHRDMDEYVMAKANIRLHQSTDDICFYCPDNSYVEQIIAAPPASQPEDISLWRSRAYPYNQPALVGVNYATAEMNTFFIHRGQVITSFAMDELRIPGRHNQANAIAAIDAALVYGVTDEAIIKGLNSFTGLPHRLKFVREVGGVTYYDDSIATTPGSAIAALDAFSQPKILILGGSPKGADFSGLAKKVADTATKQVILVGQEAPRIQACLDQVGYTAYVNLGENTTMPEIVATAAKKAKAGDVVILSPSCASFGMFKSYSDRGDQFIAAVNALGR